MKLHVPVFDKTLTFEMPTLKHYKEMLTYIHNKDNIGLCAYIDNLTDKSYNIYQKFILMLHAYKTCHNDKLTYEKENSKFLYYLEDLIEKLTEINYEEWIEVDTDLHILVRMPTQFFNKRIERETTLTTSEMNDYFINNCIAKIKVGDAVHELDVGEINQLPAFIFNKVIPHIRTLDIQFQNINLFGELNLKLSVFSMLSIIIIIFNIDINRLNEFEFVMRRYAHLTNFDDLTYKQARDLADIYSHDLQEQKDAIEDAKRQTSR